LAKEAFLQASLTCEDENSVSYTHTVAMYIQEASWNISIYINGHPIKFTNLYLCTPITYGMGKSYTQEVGLHLQRREADLSTKPPHVLPMIPLEPPKSLGLHTRNSDNM
jgi:hypothetical protein